MNARRYTIELRERPGLGEFTFRRATTVLHLDPRDDDRLREVLIERLTGFKGERYARDADLSRWSIRVMDRRGRQVAALKVDKSGRSVVKR